MVSVYFFAYFARLRASPLFRMELAKDGW